MKNPRKFRVEFARVIALTAEDGTEPKVAYSGYDDRFAYKVGKVVKPDSFDDNMAEDCGHGIHAFLLRSEAEAWSV